MKKWKPMQDRTIKAFIHESQQEVIYIIKTGFQDTFLVVHEDCHEMTLGSTFTGSKIEVEKKYNIKI
jgi:hypothetical protein